MPDIARRRQWAPSTNARLDRSHPLSQGLAAFVVDGVDLVSGRFVGTASAPASGAYGRARAGAVAVVPGVRPSTANGITFAVTVLAISPSSAHFACGVGGNGGGLGAGIYAQASGAITWINGARATFSSGVDGRTRWRSVVGTGNPTCTTVRFYIDGSLAATGTITAASPGVHDFSVGCSNGSTLNDPWVGRITHAAVWSRELSPSEAALASFDPFCMFRDRG